MKLVTGETGIKMNSWSMNNILFLDREKKKGVCTARESNPGRKNGNLA